MFSTIAGEGALRYLKLLSMSEKETAPRKRLVVIGGGFAGLNLVKHIDADKYIVTLVDSNNYHSFPPLCYQLASAGLDAASINFPLRREVRKLRSKEGRYRMGLVKTINMQEKRVITQFEEIPYDILVIAAGTTNNFFGIKDLHKYVYCLKSTSEAIRCRNDILARLERASLETDPEVRRKMLTFTVIGGGPTGVEISGALGELKRYILPREYPSIHPEELTVTLVEGSDRLLRTMSPQASRQVLGDLKHLLVDVELGKTLKSFDAENILTFGDGSQRYSSMVIWTAGVTGIAFDFTGDIKPQIGPGHRLMVDEYSALEGVEDVYAVGDIACHHSDKYPGGHPQVAQVAIQSARNLAKNLNDDKGKRRPFVYHDKGSMATVGRNRAIVDLPHLFLHGRIAWLAWMFIHLISLLGMRNKITVLTTWIWGYFTYSSSTRLLLRIPRWPERKQFGVSTTHEEG